MQMTKVFTSVALLAVIGASTARADQKDFLNRCTPAAFRACVSLQVLTTLNGSGGTNVVIRVRNLAGSGYMYQNGGGSLVTRIGILAPHIASASGLVMTAVGGATNVNNAQLPWVLRSPGGLGGPIELTAGNSGGNDGGIAGCVPGASGYQVRYFETCGPTSWVEFSFTTSNAWSANQAEVAWFIADMSNPAGGAEECGSIATGPNRAFCGVAPEPVTMVLLGSGLAGMGGFGVLRRRKKNGDVENV